MPFLFELQEEELTVFFQVMFIERQVPGELHSGFRQGTESTSSVIYFIYEVPKKKVMVSYGEGIVLSFVTDK